jgi:hypothetical protein
MSIVTTNPAKVTVRLLEHSDLTQDQIFKIAHFIDSYEIEKQLQDTLVIDIYKVTKTGEIELVLTPKTGLSYDTLSEHLQMIVSFALQKVNLADCKWEITKLEFQTEKFGKPSYVFDEPQSIFRAD